MRRTRQWVHPNERMAHWPPVGSFNWGYEMLRVREYLLSTEAPARAGTIWRYALSRELEKQALMIRKTMAGLKQTRISRRDICLALGMTPTYCECPPATMAVRFACCRCLKFQVECDVHNMAESSPSGRNRSSFSPTSCGR